MYLHPVSQVNKSKPARTYESLGPDETPLLGAHLVTPRWGFAHHGIYTGNGKVVHYGALLYDLVRRPVEEVPLESFAQGRPVFLIRHAETCRDPAEVIRLARSRLGENRYSVWTNNCEHFCEWCLHGESRSFQVEDALELPQRIGDWLLAAIREKIREKWVRTWSGSAPVRMALRWDPHETESDNTSRGDRAVGERLRRE
jgi:hypothetical protein